MKMNLELTDEDFGGLSKSDIIEVLEKFKKALLAMEDEINENRREK